MPTDIIDDHGLPELQYWYIICLDLVSDTLYSYACVTIWF